MKLTSEAFNIIEEMAASEDGRNKLMHRQGVRLIASFQDSQPHRVAAVYEVLRDWSGLPDLKKAVAKFIKGSDELRAQQYLESKVAKASKAGQPVLEADKPVMVAEQFIAARRPHLMFSGNEWLDYVGNCYVAMEDREVRSGVQHFMASGIDKETGEAFHPTRPMLDNAMDALRNLCFRSNRESEPPAWLEKDGTEPDPRMVIAARNGLLDVTGQHLMPHHWSYFTRNGLDYDFLRDAPPPLDWLGFLQSIWPIGEGGQENHDALQEVFGYLLTGETKWQKLFLLIGAPNAGKGVIARVLEGLIGSRNMVSQSVTKLGREFGLKALLGKSVLVVPDLRLGRDANIGGITETLLNISGEDALNIGRKFEDDKQVRLNTRVVLCANMELSLPDQSGAMRRRLYPLVFPKSFVGREDFGLADKLLAELPGILLWSLEGLRRLESRVDSTGRKVGFVLTAEGRKMVQRIARRGSPINEFLRDACELGVGLSVPKAKLFAVFETWHEEVVDEQSHHTEEMFGRELRVAAGYHPIKASKPRVDGVQVPHYEGLGLKPEWASYGY